MGRMMEPQNNPFYSPFGHVLVKAEEVNNKWIVYLQASNEHLDQDEERILAKALQEAKDYYISHGIISWDHQHSRTNDPSYIIGEPLEVEFSKSNETMVKGWLYQKNAVSRKVWDNIQSGATKLGASVGGGILSKSKGTIDRVIWSETAITHKPVNDGTLGHVQVIPFAEFAKALMAGSGTNAESYSGGRALTGESIDDTLTDGTFAQTDVSYEEGRRFFDSLMIKIKQNKIKSMNDVVNYVREQGYTDSVASVLIEFVASKIPSLR